MLDVDTFLTTLYVIVDDFCQSHRSRQRRPGPEASLSEGEVITLAIFARWSRFCSERDFYRYAEGYLRGAFPTLPERSQFNRLVRFYAEAIEEIALHLGQTVEGEQPPYQALDASAMPVRDAKRRGHGWLAGRADIGWSNSLGWYEGFSLLIAVEPSGVITGFCFGAASTADQPLAETFFNLRANPNPRLISVGSAFWGLRCRQGLRGRRKPPALVRELWCRCHPSAQAQLQKAKLVQRLRRWVAGIRQIVETVFDKLFNTFGLWRERPHEIAGLRARLAARVALHNFCIWLNDQLGRPRLKFADLMGW